VYQDDTDGSFKIGRSSFKLTNKHVVCTWEKVQGYTRSGNY